MLDLQGLRVEFRIADRDHAFAFSEQRLLLGDDPLAFSNSSVSLGELLPEKADILGDFGAIGLHDAHIIRFAFSDQIYCEDRGQIFNQPASLGASVRSGDRQSIPSHNIDSWAGVNIAAPSCVNGQTNRPLSSLFEYRQRPVPSHHKIFILSARLPRKAKMCPAYGFFFIVSCTSIARPSNPFLLRRALRKRNYALYTNMRSARR